MTSSDHFFKALVNLISMGFLQNTTYAQIKRYGPKYIDLLDPLPSRPGEDGVKSEAQQQIAVAGVESGESSAWEMFYDDEGAEEPVPWWFNSVTGESTWDRPAALMSSADPAGGDAGEQHELEQARVNREPGVTRGWTRLWSEEYQVQTIPRDNGVGAKLYEAVLVADIFFRFVFFYARHEWNL